MVRALGISEYATVREEICAEEKNAEFICANLASI